MSVKAETVVSSRLGEAAIDAFSPWLHSRTGALANVVRHAADWAVADDQHGEIVIDKRALLIGLLRVLPVDPRGDGLGWLRLWVEAHGWLGGDPRPPPTALRLLQNGGRIIASRSLLSDVLPVARDIARRATRREHISLRHMILALLRPSAGWAEIGIRADGHDFADARARCLAWVASIGRPEDDLTAWAELTGGATPPERLATQSDDPAFGDRLGRLPFAQVLAERIREARAAEVARPGPNRAFMVHLHGPWGSGKSSILRFLRDELKAANPGWVTVDFNAWQTQSQRPIWWSIINDVRRQANAQVDWRRRLRIGAIWWLWKLRADLLPMLLAVALFVIAMFGLFGSQIGADKVFSLVTAAIAAGGAVYALSRTVVFGSSHAARAYAELKTDPYTPVIRLFCRLVEAIDRPLLVCVDDVDRCDTGTVVDLLEGIQTLLRDAPVTYAIAGDRKWICASFEKRYADFHDRISEPGRPLGYLFLDKLFQVSTAVPRMSGAIREQFWGGLLHGESGDTSHASDVREAEARVAGIVGQEELQHQIDAAAGPEQRQALRAAAALQITRSAARTESEHRFRIFAGLLERNPRSMKRLVNALGMNQALAFLEGRSPSPEALARWTILELRWPLLADWISGNAEADPSDCPLATLFDDADVKAVIGCDGAAGRLDRATLKLLHE